MLSWKRQRKIYQKKNRSLKEKEMPQKQNLQEKLESNLRRIKQLERKNEETKKQIESGITEVEFPPMGKEKEESLKKAYAFLRAYDKSYFLLHKDEKEMPNKVNLEEQLNRNQRLINRLERENEEIKKRIESGMTEIDVLTPEERLEIVKSHTHTLKYFKTLIDKEEKKEKERKEKES